MPRMEETGRVPWCFWDSVTVTTTMTESNLFTIPLGGGATPKTLLETNLSVAGQLPEGMSFQIRGFSWQMQPDASVVSGEELSNGYWRFIATDKPWQERPFLTTPGGGGLWIQQMGTAVDHVAPGVPDARNVLSMDVPITLNPGEPFRVECKWAAAPTADTKMWFFLDGILDRSVS